MEQATEPVRILIVDDEMPVRDAYQRILSKAHDSDLDHELAAMETELFGDSERIEAASGFDLTLCKQGDEAVEVVKASLERGEPFAVGFLDVRMPPGPDGVQTGEWIRELDPNIQLVFVTGYSDYEPSEITHRIQPTDQLFYVQKPLRPQELRQFAVALCSRWMAERHLDENQEELVLTNERLWQEVAVRARAEDLLPAPVHLDGACAGGAPPHLLRSGRGLRGPVAGGRPWFLLRLLACPGKDVRCWGARGPRAGGRMALVSLWSSLLVVGCG